ncbi:MAG: hypothetical protein RBR35_04865 [Salinivirgaceae bacterium]|nr:hypothetical protein [Salinivirgaceae bacterium]
MKKTAFLFAFIAFTAITLAQESIVNKSNLGLAYTNGFIPRISINVANDTTTGSFTDRALNILYSRRNYFKLNENNEFQVDEIRQSPAGVNVLVQQTRNGVKIREAKGVVSFNQQGEISCVSLDGSSANFTINTAPTFLLMDAINAITSHFSPKSTQIAESKAELVIIQKDSAAQLAWQFYATPQGGTSYWCAVDAHTNQIIQCADASAYYNPPQGTGKVFNPDPGSYLGVDNLPDSADANYFPVDTAYSIETLQGLIQSADGKWRLQGEFAYVHDGFAPFLGLAEETEPIFHYTRDNDHFEEVNAYFHLDKQMRYIRSLGLIRTGMGIS